MSTPMAVNKDLKTDPEGYEPVQWETVDQLSERIPQSKDWIYEKALKGEIPAHRVGRNWLFNPREIDEHFSSYPAAPENQFKKTQRKRNRKNPGLGRAPYDRELKNSGRSQETHFLKAKGGNHGS